MPYGQLRPRGYPVWMTTFVDASHAVNKVTLRSQTGLIIELVLFSIVKDNIQWSQGHSHQNL
jgi:hypothetical protein